MKALLKLQMLYGIVARLSKREKMVLYGALTIVSLMLIDRMIIFPIFYKMDSLTKEIQEKEQGIRKNLRILSQKDKILAASAKYSAFAISAKSEEEEITSILKEIENMANKSSVYLIDMKPAGLKEMGSAKKYSINLNCEAQMEQVTDFMYSIENSNKLLSIDKYQISPKSKESSVAKFSMTISKIVVP